MSDMMLGLGHEGFSQVKEICLYPLGVHSLKLEKDKILQNIMSRVSLEKWNY